MYWDFDMERQSALMHPSSLGIHVSDLSLWQTMYRKVPMRQHTLSEA